MTTLEKSPNTPPYHIVAIGGGGCHVDNASITFRMIRAEAEDNNIRYHPVHGCTDESGVLSVRPPSEQTQVLATVMEDIPHHETILLAAQCMGGIALVNYLDNNNNPNVRGLIFAPATQPSFVVSHPVSQQRRHNNGTIMRLSWLTTDIRDFEITNTRSVDARLPPTYLAEAHAEKDVLKRMAHHVQNGRLALIAADLDWNTTSPADVYRMQSASPPPLPDQLQILPSAGHSLHTPGGSGADANCRIAAQRRRVKHVLGTGTHLFSAR